MEVDAQALDDWFVREVLPLEAILMRYLRRHWHDEAELQDLRQEVYSRVYASARRCLPAQTQPFMLTSARNLIIDRIRRSRIVSIEAMADIDTIGRAADHITPDRHITARDELRRFQMGLERLPSRCRQVVELRKIEGLSQKEVAARMGIGEDAVERQTLLGMRALADFMLGGSGRICRVQKRASKESKQP